MSYIGKTPTPSALTSSDIADGIVTNPKLSTGSQQNFRNIIINGDMSIAQRATSTTGITGGAYNTADRFYLNMGTAGTWTNTISTDVPTGQGFAKSFKLDCTTANASLSSGSYMTVQQRFEGQNLQYLKKGTSSAKSLTLSFWVKSNKTGTYIALLKDNDNGRDISKSYTISSANTWEKKTITYAGDTTGAFGNDNATSLELKFILVAGTNYTSGTLATSWESQTDANSAVGQVNLADSTSNDWYVTGIQLEAGTTASEFEFLPVDVNLQRCQRYFELQQTSYFTVSRYNSSLSYGALAYFKTEKRANPTIAKLNGTTTVAAHGANEGSHSNDEFIANEITTTGCSAQVTTGSAYLTWFCGLDSPLTFNSEL